MFFQQFVDGDLGCASYLIGDADTGAAVVVDPAFEIEQYVAAAAAEGLSIERVLETHTHADHLSGHGRFALEYGVPTSIHPLARPAYRFDPLSDGLPILVGSVEILVIATPGHRPEHCSFLVDRELVLTGDSLFVREAARPDLAIEPREGAAALFRSLQRLAELPGYVAVYPGHVAGTLCGTNMSDEHSSTIGREKRTNHALKSEEESFVDESSSLTTPRPPTAEWLVELNRGGWVAAKTPPALLEGPGDAIVLDVRPVEIFAGGHFSGAISVALDGGSFATRAAFVLDPGERFVVHARSQDELDEAVRLLWAVGLFEELGYVVAGDATETTETLTVAEFARLLDGDAAPQVLDVREPSEREGTTIPGAVEIPYRELRTPDPDALDQDRPVYTICASGARAMLAASLLARLGFDARAIVDGGVVELANENAQLVERS